MPLPLQQEHSLSSMLCPVELHSSHISPKEIFLIDLTCNFKYALEAWKTQKNKEARLLIQPYTTSGIKWFLTYCMTWMPFSVFKIIYRLKGGILI